MLFIFLNKSRIMVKLLSMINGNVEVIDGQLRGSHGSYALPEALQNLENQKLTHPYYWSAFTLIGSPW